MRKAATLLALMLPLAAQAQETGDLVQFVACPVYRDADAGRKSGCWLADDPVNGTRWDVTQSPYKPNWNFAVLVEGRVTDDSSELCGSPVLNPVRTSRISMRCPQHMLPAEDYPGRAYTLPPRNIAPMGAPREAPEGPFGPRTFYTFYEFDRSFIVYQYSDYLIDQAVTWISAAQPRKLIVTGFAATDPIEITGVTLAESEETAQERAELVALSLTRLFPEMNIELKWETGSRPVDAADADTLPLQSQRRVEIEAVF